MAPRPPSTGGGDSLALADRGPSTDRRPAGRSGDSLCERMGLGVGRCAEYDERGLEGAGESSGAVRCGEESGRVRNGEVSGRWRGTRRGEMPDQARPEVINEKRRGQTGPGRCEKRPVEMNKMEARPGQARPDLHVGWHKWAADGARCCQSSSVRSVWCNSWVGG